MAGAQVGLHLMADESAKFDEEFTIDDIVVHAYRRCGYLNIGQSLDDLDPAYSGHGKRTLKLIVDHLVTRGINQKNIEFFDLQLTEGVYRYTLPNTALLIVSDGMYFPPGEPPDRASGETLVKQIHINEWHMYSAKNAVARPTQFAASRPTPNEIFFWPIPDEAGTVRLRLQQYYPNTNEGQDKLSLRSYWNKFFVFQLAYELSIDLTMPATVQGSLKMNAAEAFRFCRIHAKPVVAEHAPVFHPTPWNR